MQSGRCEVTAALAVQDITVVSRQGHLDLPGMVAFRQGIRLLPAHEYPTPEYPTPEYPAHELPGARLPSRRLPGWWPAAVSRVAGRQPFRE